MKLTTTQAICALRILSRRLEEISKAEAGAGLAKSSADTTKEKEFVEQFIDSAETVLKRDLEEISPRQRVALRNGLRLYVKNARSASGTCIGLGRTKWAEDLVAEADAIEAEILPLVDDQAALALASSK